jgi:hypothetical protein
MAEFDLTINGGANKGIYDPAPAFWSATCTNCSGGIALSAAADPPISSAIFTLNPDGTVSVSPVFGTSGGPIQQPNETPEPASLWLIAPALALLFRRRISYPRQ